MGLPVSRRRLLRASNEQGSILLITIVSVAVVALLGLAVYDLALIEAQFSAGSVIDYRAYEFAQAGIERGIRELRNIYMAGTPGQETFVHGSTTCAPTPCDTTQFHPMNVANTTVPSRTVTAGPFTGAVDPGGSYTLELKYVTMPEVNNSVGVVGEKYPFGLQCIKDNVFSIQEWCANVAFLRSSGTATDGAGNTRTRTIQTLVIASTTSPWAGGIVAGNGSPPGSPAVSGEVLVAGGIHVLGGPSSNPTVSIGGGSNAGVMNSWYALDSSSTYSQSEPTNDTLSRLTPRRLICPPATNCTGGTNLVESLGAEIKIYGNINGQMFNAVAGTPIGLAGVTAPYVEPQRLGNRGKGALDGIYIAGGCKLPCIGSAPQPFNSGASILVDRGNLTKPYPNRPPIGPLSTLPNGTWPTINDVVTIYNYSTLTPTNPAYFDWFKTHTDAASGCTGGCTASIVASTPVNAANCVASTRVVNCNHDVQLGSLLTSIVDGPSSRFRHSFTFRDRGDNPRTAEICWRRDTMGSDSGSSPPSRTLEFGMPTCETPNSPANPVLLWIHFPWGIDRSSGNPYRYRGAAIIVTSGGFHIDESFQSYCPAAPCSNNKFPEDHLFAIMTESGDIDLASSSSAVSRMIMGYFFVSGGNIRVGRDVNIAGMLRADSICFRNSSGCGGGVPSGGKVPGFFQASFPDARRIPNELPAPYAVPSQASGGRWQVTSVPQFWIECRRAPSDTLPPAPSGICGYDQ